jgi:hypothetical protein
MTTLLTSQWKTGKTTLAAALLARMKEGGEFAGLALRPGKAIIISEESPVHWYQRNQRLAFGDHLCWFCRPFVCRPSLVQWQALLATVLDLHVRHQFDLVLVDPLQHFVRSENSGQAMLDFLHTFDPLLAAGLAVWLSHHPRKGRFLEGQAARGSGTLSGYIDIVMEMSLWARPGTRASAGEPDAGGEAERRRRIAGFSRWDDTVKRLVIELNAEGTDYRSRGQFELDGFDENWKQLRTILHDSCGKLTRRQVRRRWPSDFPAPDPSTLWRWLETAVERGLLHKAGLGSRKWPFQYWQPERENDWLFAHFNQRARASQEYHQVLSDMGYFPPFFDVPREDKGKAQALVAQRLFPDAPPPLAELFDRDAVEPQPPSVPVAEAPASEACPETPSTPVPDQAPPAAAAEPTVPAEPLPAAPADPPAPVEPAPPAAVEPPAVPEPPPFKPPANVPYPWGIVNPAEWPAEIKQRYGRLVGLA